MSTGVIKWKGYNGDKTKTTIDGLIDKAAMKVLLQHLDNYTLASMTGYRLEPAFETDVAEDAVDGDLPYVRDQMRLKFDIIKTTGGEVESLVMTIPAPDSTYVEVGDGNRRLMPADGILIAGYLKTATGWDSVTYSGSKFKSAIVKG